jgi:hypothetical protein
MKNLLRLLFVAVISLLPVAAYAQGTTPLALAQQIDANGVPLSGCLTYFYQAGTVATPQNAYADFGLSQPLPNPLPCSTNARIPMHWLANGLVHVRLTDASGNVQVDQTLQVLGPSTGGGGGGGGGGATIDPTTIAATGDIKYRLTSELLTGWVILNGQTIGSAVSGASQRANADTQNLFVYLWTNCIQAHCPVSGGRGVTALADFSGNKTITLYDMRDSLFVGRDCMGNTCLGGLLASNISSGGGDGVDTPAAWGGVANLAIGQANLPNVNFFNTGIAVANGATSIDYHYNNGGYGNSGTTAFAITNGGSYGNTSLLAVATDVYVSAQGYSNSGGSGTPFPLMNPFKLVTSYMKL